MPMILVLLGALLLIAGGAPPVAAADLADKVKVETVSVGLHPGMDPGMYVCAGGHLHIKAVVTNLAGVPVGPVKVAAKAFDAAGTLLGTASGTSKEATLAPNEKAEVDVEFLTVTGSRIQKVKRHELAVVQAPAKR